MFELRKKNKELKNQLLEKRKIKSFKKPQKLNKLEIKAIRKANKTPKGKKFIKNNDGNIIDVKNINKTYINGWNKYLALKDVSLTIKKGEFIVILGPSGSGKTTLLNVLSGLDRPTSGEIIINNINIAALSNKKLTTFRRNNVGFVFQSYNLLLELNAIDNAEMGRQLQVDNNKRLNVSELFDQLGLANKKTNLISQLSSGQLQRVSIIRTLAKNPTIIFADEPTGALDSETSKKIIQIFKNINQKYNTTIVIVTHNTSITNIANKIIKVKDGITSVQNK